MGEPAPGKEEARLEALEPLFLEALETGNGPPPAGRPAAAGAANNGQRPLVERGTIGAPTPTAAPYLWAAALGGLMLGKPERKRRLKVEGPPEGWRR